MDVSRSAYHAHTATHTATHTAQAAPHAIAKTPS
jgi:hypothetical protein